MALTFSLFGQELGDVFPHLWKCGGVEEGEKAKKPAEQRGKNEEYRASPAPSGYGQSRGRRAAKKNRRKRSGKSGQARKGGLTQRYNPYGRPQSGNSGNVQMIPVVPWPVAEVCRGTESWVHNRAHFNSAGVGAEDCKNKTIKVPGLGELISHGTETQVHNTLQYSNSAGSRAEDGHYKFDFKIKVSANPESLGQIKETQVHNTVHSNSAGEGAEDCKNNITVPEELIGQGMETKEGIEIQVHNTAHSNNAGEGAEDCKNNITEPGEMIGQGIETKEGIETKMHNTVHSNSAGEGTEDDIGKNNIIAQAELIGQGTETKVHNTAHSNSAGEGAEDLPSNRAENVLRMVSCAENGQFKITVPADPESLGQVAETEAHNTLLSQTSTSAEDCTEDGWHKITVLHGKKYDKELLTFLLKTMCPVPFQFTDFHYVKSRHMVFYVPDKATADDLQSLSRKIKTRNGKLCILKRFDAATSTLNLSNLYWDTELQAQDIHVVLNQKFYMNSVIAIIMEIVPVIDHLDISNNRLYNLNSLADLVPIREGVTSLNLSQNENYTFGKPFTVYHKVHSQIHINRRHPNGQEGLAEQNYEHAPQWIRYDNEKTNPPTTVY
uniref:Uncharacterized protein n=1 Tax=Branchiostoma floridae TaxID=7739 RepID=C3ZF40_BRAFL|eukprot:XP_002593335.1 hypothetical protein BRAFLDRAFT_70889 [Branchiostoma floridae]